MADMIGGGRPMTTCPRCHQTDDHPICAVPVPEGWQDWHQDCHRIAFGDMPCHPHLADDAGAGLTGADMLEHVLAWHAANPETEV